MPHILPDGTAVDCPRCGGTHPVERPRRFVQGACAGFTHWTTCPATGEPMLTSEPPAFLPRDMDEKPQVYDADR